MIHRAGAHVGILALISGTTQYHSYTTRYKMGTEMKGREVKRQNSCFS